MIPIFLAIDTPNTTIAFDLLSKVGDRVDIKLGLEFFIANGINGCRFVRNLGTKNRQRQLFLDLKLHDIPATVAGAIRSAAGADPDYITIHASGGIPMMQAAVEAANTLDPQYRRPKILGVTVLTSDSEPLAQARTTELALKAHVAGLDGLVCSAHDVRHLRSVLKDRWPDVFLMVPGIRAPNADKHDQQRTATAREAMLAGASALVVGREIRNALDPAQATDDIISSMQ